MCSRDFAVVILSSCSGTKRNANTRAGIDAREQEEPAVPFENNAAQQFVQMDQLARLPGERGWEKEHGSGRGREVAREKGRLCAREIQTEREREREGDRHKAILGHYVRTSMYNGCSRALVGVVSLDVPVRRTNRTEGRTRFESPNGGP